MAPPSPAVSRDERGALIQMPQLDFRVRLRRSIQVARHAIVWRQAAQNHNYMGGRSEGGFGFTWFHEEYRRMGR
eukprot:5121639-Pyramimonas_sp.AAC.1